MNQLLTQLKQLWDKQPKGRRILAIAVLLGVIGIVAITTLTNHAPEWVSVSEGASPDDTAELMQVLQQGGVNARLNNGKVEVAKADAEKAMSVARAAGLPHTGKGMELFDGTNLGQSSFAEQVNYVRALEGELARSIASLAQVQGARVHLAMGKQSVFKDQSQPPTASVSLHLHAGQTLTGEQVRGVRQLVAAGVAGMAADSVVVVDSHGNLLDGAAPGTADQKATIEQTVATRVRTMLERVVGQGKVSVVATATVDERKVSETQEVYDSANPAIRSETRTVEGTDAAAAAAASTTSGVAGVRGNLPGAPAASPTPGGGNGRLQETKNYELSRTVRQTTKPDVQLAKLQLAVVVDYKEGADGKPAPRSDKELAELTALARQAAGIDDTRGDKIEVRSIAFAPDPELADAAAAAAAAAPAAASELPIIPIAAGAGGLVLLVVIALLVKRSRAKKRAAAKPLSLALPAPVSELERVLDAKPSNDRTANPDFAKPDIAGAIANAAPGLPPGRPVRERVLDAVRDDLDRTAEVLTAWLAEGQPKGAKS